MENAITAEVWLRCAEVSGLDTEALQFALARFRVSPEVARVVYAP